MLKQVRKSLKGILAVFVVVLLVLSFAAWQVPELRNFTQNAALRVGDKGFSTAELKREFDRELVARRLQSGETTTQAEAVAQGVHDQIITRMATRSVLEQEAGRLGLAVPRDVVRDYLNNAEAFKNPQTGKFDTEVFSAIQRSYNISAREFENEIRGGLLRDQLVKAASVGSGAPSPLVQSVLMREIERRNVSYVTVTEEMAGIPKEPTPDDFQTFYNGNPDLFTAPEFRTFTAVVLQTEDFRDGMTVEEEKLREIYDATKARSYDEPEKRTLYQTTFDTEAEAAAAVASLVDGKPFENVASERGLSLDAVTFTDIVKDDILDPNVQEAVFNAERAAGDIIGPIQGLFGYTAVQIVEVTAPTSKTFEEVRGEIEEQLFASDSRKALLKAVEEVEEGLDTGASLNEAAAAAGIEAKTFGPVDNFSFGKGGEIIADIPGEVLKEVFEMEEGDESPALELAERKGYFFVSLSEIQDPAVFPYENVADEVEQRWRTQEREGRIANAVEQMRAAVQGGASLTEAAEPFSRAPVDAVLSRRPDEFAEIAGALSEDVFQADKGAIISGPVGANGAQAIVVINDIVYDESALNPGQEAGMSQFLGYQLDQELLDAYATSLQQDYNVRRNQAAIDQLFSEGG